MAPRRLRPTATQGIALTLAVGLFASIAGGAGADSNVPAGDPSATVETEPSAAATPAQPSAEPAEMTPSIDPAAASAEDGNAPEPSPSAADSELAVPDLVDETPIDSPYVDLWGPGVADDGFGAQSNSGTDSDIAAQADNSPESPRVTNVVVPPRLPNETVTAIHLTDGWTTQATIGFSFGRVSDEYIAGDWDGNGSDSLGIRNGAMFYLRNALGDGAADKSFAYGRAGDELYLGDWDGNGTDTFAVRRGNAFHIRNSLSSGQAEKVVTYGRVGDEVFVGDWDGDGKDTFAVRRGNTYHVRNSMTSGPADVAIDYGRPNDEVIVGDWDGDGKDTFAVRRGNTYHVRNSMTSGPADIAINYGRATDEVVVGDWNNDKKDTLGVIRRDGAVSNINAANDPRGNLETVTPNSDGTITVKGWAFDPDLRGAPVVQVFVDSQPQLTRASLPRTDVKNAYNLSFDTVGFKFTLNTTPGQHRVCVNVINEGLGSNKTLRCATVTAVTPKPNDPSKTFTPGTLISDAVMFNKNTMTTGQIQTFLNNRNPNCTPGSAACLKDYRARTSTMTAPYCSTYVGAANETAATMIFKSAQACGINPQVLIVKLQKEQALVTASGASLTETKYQKALGYGCPDNAGCNPSYAGLAQQLYYAASGLIRYGEEPQRYNFRAGQTANIQYHPNVSCGSSPVYIENRATAALYNYTPYQPNAAALANMAGEGDACSTYGNRNFWRIFNSWFGSTH
ncbi:hypothetical protein VR010_04375 [Actinomycetaceae bacterium L2_0104]